MPAPAGRLLSTFVREKRCAITGVAGKLVTIDNIRKTVAEYYKIKIARICFLSVDLAR